MASRRETITCEVREKSSKEIAEIFIYLLSMSHDLGIDLVEVAAKKLDERRLPSLVSKVQDCSAVGEIIPVNYLTHQLAYHTVYQS